MTSIVFCKLKLKFGGKNENLKKILGKKIENFEKKLNSKKFWKLEKIGVWKNFEKKMGYLGKFWKFRKKIWKKNFNLKKTWKIGKNYEIWGKFGKQLEIWKNFKFRKFGKLLEFWKSFGNME